MRHTNPPSKNHTAVIIIRQGKKCNRFKEINNTKFFWKIFCIAFSYVSWYNLGIPNTGCKKKNKRKDRYE